MKFLQYLNFLILFASMPPAAPINYMPWALIYFFSNYVIRRRDIIWWLKYNCNQFSLSLTKLSDSHCTLSFL
jgi:hypothetical protein